MADMGGADYMSNTRKTVSVGASHISIKIGKCQSNEELKVEIAIYLKYHQSKQISELCTMFIDKTA